LTAEELELVSSPPQAEDIPAPARKKPRLEEPRPTTTDVAARKTASPEVSEEVTPPTADDDDANSIANPATDTQPDAGATGRWTLEEDARLTRAAANTSKRKRGKKSMTNWPAVSELIPGRTRRQCWSRWQDFLDTSIGTANRLEGSWTSVEDSKLKDAVQTDDGKNWAAISALVAGRTRSQCKKRWYNYLNPNIALAAGRKGKWTLVDEDSKLKDAVQTHGGKDWFAISALVLGRTPSQRGSRWHNALDPSIDRRKGGWTLEEDSKLKAAVQTHGGKNWAAIAALVPGRTKNMCCSRWYDVKNSAVIDGGSCGVVPSESEAVGELAFPLGGDGEE
jgi:hypothetical protein